MSMRTIVIFVLFSASPLVTIADDTLAQEKPEQLPAPKQSMPAAPGGPFYIPYPILPAHPPRFDNRNVWSLYGPDQNGRLRPRVVLSPYGSYYLYNGEPFPWTTQPRLVMPKTSD